MMLQVKILALLLYILYFLFFFVYIGLKDLLPHETIHDTLPGCFFRLTLEFVL